MKKIDVKLIENLSTSERRNSFSADQGSDSGSRFSRKTDMSPALVHVLQEVQRELGLGAEDGEEVRPGSAELEGLIAKIADRLGLELTTYERDQVLARVEDERKDFGLLQELVDDPQVTDIIVSDSTKISVQQGRKNYHTDLSFPSEASYEGYVERLLKKAGTTYSTKKPIADGMIGSFARVHAVHKVLCETGPYITIRLNRFSEVSVDDLMKVGMAPKGIFDYLRAIVQTGQTLLIVGEVGTGKTTLARALASTIPQRESILVIEDTPEIKLEHPHVRYMRTREANIEGAGRISPSACIRGGMRMAMNRIIFGEMRDAEAAEAFIDVCSSGHPGLSTIHAKSSSDAIIRLELFLGRAQKGVEARVISQQVATAVQVIVFVNICSATGMRRITEVKEIGPYADGVLRQKDMFRYDSRERTPSWKVSNRLSTYRDLIESIDEKVVLSTYPPKLELTEDVVYKEAAFLRSA